MASVGYAGSFAAGPGGTNHDPCSIAGGRFRPAPRQGRRGRAARLFATSCQANGGRRKDAGRRQARRARPLAESGDRGMDRRWLPTNTLEPARCTMSSTPFFDGTDNAKRNRAIADQNVPKPSVVPVIGSLNPRVLDSPPASQEVPATRALPTAAENPTPEVRDSPPVIGVPEVPATPAVPIANDNPNPGVPDSPPPSSPTGRKKSLTEIMRAGDRDCIQSMWATTPMAAEFAPLPASVYVARIISGELINSRQKGTPGYKLTFEVLEGEHRGRKFWADNWLTPAALPGTKRDLAKLGITSLEQLERPLPQGIRCKVNLALRRNDDGSEYNSVKSFTVVGIDPPEAEPFAPSSNSPTPHQSPLSAAGGAS